MENPFIELKVKHFRSSPFQPLVIGDYQPKENFPDCCPFHKNVMAWAEEYVKKVPNCCDAHRILATNPLVDISYYKTDEFAASIVRRLSYTEHHIERMIDQRNWYTDITNYIEYIISSFGTPSFGDHVYSRSLTTLIEARKDKIGQNKAQRLNDYIRSLYQQLPSEPVAEEIDLNQLYHIYQKWLSIFPFTVQPFNQLKDRFTNIFPILEEEPVYNPYTGFSKSRIITKGKLIEWLINKTKEILKSANSIQLLQDGYTDVNAYRIDLLNEQHKARQAALLNEFSKHENQYVQIIAKWLSNEEKYYKSVTPLLSKLRPKTNLTSKVSDTRINVFNPPMSLAEVRKWFIQLAENSSINGNPFLTIEQVKQFIDRAFIGDINIQKLTFNMAVGERTSITKLFYLFFQRCTSDYAIEPTKHCKEKYVRLLTDNFTNYNYDTVFDTFNNSRNAPKQWKTTV